MNRVPLARRVQIINCLVEGNSIRSTERMTGIDVDATGFVGNYDPPEDADADTHRVGRTARARAADTLRHVGLFEERYRPIGGYSTGMKPRVKLAQALVTDPHGVSAAKLDLG